MWLAFRSGPKLIRVYSPGVGEVKIGTQQCVALQIFCINSLGHRRTCQKQSALGVGEPRLVFLLGGEDVRDPFAPMVRAHLPALLLLELHQGGSLAHNQQGNKQVLNY